MRMMPFAPWAPYLMAMDEAAAVLAEATLAMVPRSAASTNCAGGGRLRGDGGPLHRHWSRSTCTTGFELRIARRAAPCRAGCARSARTRRTWPWPDPLVLRRRPTSRPVARGPPPARPRRSACTTCGASAPRGRCGSGRTHGPAGAPRRGQPAVVMTWCGSAPVFTPRRGARTRLGRCRGWRSCRARCSRGEAAPVLFTDQANPTSNRFYQALGYEPAVDTVQLALR